MKNLYMMHTMALAIASLLAGSVLAQAGNSATPKKLLQKQPVQLAQAETQKASPPLSQRARSATRAKKGKWYVGGSVGRGGFDADYVSTKASIASTGANTFTTRADAKSTMWKTYVGYELSPSVSVEGGYWNFGKLSYTADISAPVTTSMQRKFRADGYGANVVLWQPFTGSLSGFAKGGAIWTSVRAGAADPAGLTSLPAETARRLTSMWGLGIKYDISPEWATRLEYESVRKVGDAARFGNADVIMLSFGVNYNF